MFRENCSPHQENLPAYSLGALEAEAVSMFESHLKTCGDCQTELAEFQKITAGLLHSIPPRMPSPNLRRNLITQLASPQKRTSSLIPRRIAKVSLGQFATTAIMLILLVMNIFSARQIRVLQDQQTALAERLSTEQAAVALLAYPNTQAHVVNADVQDLTGSVLVDRDKTIAVLFLWNLPNLEPGEVYQVWLINANGERLNGGLFTPAGWQNYTTAFIQSSVPLGEFIGIGVTVEPWGGSEQPTGSRILSVDL